MNGSFNALDQKTESLHVDEKHLDGLLLYLCTF